MPGGDFIKIFNLKKHTEFKLSSTQVLVLGFAGLIAIGTILLNLPAASVDGKSMGFVNALFEATSAVCVTGLVVVDTGTQLTMFGQIVILILLQIGGLGIMTMATMVFLIVGKRITLKERLIMQEALNQFTLEGLVRLTRNILLVTFIIEFSGAVLLSIKFIPEFGWGRGIYYSIFHAVSAFCNAGFDLIGGYRSFTPYVDDALINIVFMSLIIIGGLGFTVVMDLRRSGFRWKKWSLHTRIVIMVSGVLILFGFIFFLLVEWSNPATLGRLSPSGKIFGAMFQSITTRTAGFNTIDTASLRPASKFMTILMMFVGASPASTGGGIKTVTAFVVVMMAINLIRNRDDIEIFKRRLQPGTGKKALTIALISLTIFLTMVTVISLIESIEFIDILFEVGSALGTVGLSTISNGNMKVLTKLLVTFTMFIGRLGPLTIAMALSARNGSIKNNLRYPENKVIVG